MAALAPSVSIGELMKVRLIDAFQKPHHRALEYLVFQRRESKGAQFLTVVAFRYPYSFNRGCPISALAYRRMEPLEVLLKIFLVLLRFLTINPWCRLFVQAPERLAQ